MALADHKSSKYDDTLKRIERKLDILIRDKKTEESRDVWLDEEDAARIMKWSTRYLRRNVKQGAHPVRYRTFRGRDFKYLKSDIERIKGLTF